MAIVTKALRVKDSNKEILITVDFDKKSGETELIEAGVYIDNKLQVDITDLLNVHFDLDSIVDKIDWKDLSK